MMSSALVINESSHVHSPRWKQWLVPLIGLALLAAALYAIHAITTEVHWRDVTAAMRTTPPMSMIVAALLTISSYVALTGYDSLALRHLGYALPYRTAAFASFTSYTMAHTLGLTALTGGSVRYRIYSAAKVSGPDIALIIALCGFTFWLSAVGLLGISLLMEPYIGGLVDHLGTSANIILGAVLLLAVTAYAFLSALRTAPVSVGNWLIKLPGLKVTLQQLLLGSVDIFFAGAALYMLQPDADLNVAVFAGAYIVALTLGAVSHSPGGIGVFEVLILLMLPVSDKSGVLGALLLYRVIYTLIPFVLGALMLTLRESQGVRNALSPIVSPVAAIIRTSAPLIVAALVFVSGLILLLSAATPTALDRVLPLQYAIPLPLVEISHLSASLIAVTLMILAWGLSRRLSAAFTLAVPLLAIGAAAAMLKGFDYEEALILLIVLALLLGNRLSFYRKSRLLDEPLSPAWSATIAAGIFLASFVGLIAYRHIPYQDGLWLSFDMSGDASRFLRAGLAVVASGFAAVVFYALRRPKHEAHDRIAPEQLQALLLQAQRTDANLAFLGDKKFLLGKDGQSALMYAVQGNSWIVMGDPIGNVDDFPGLLWDFSELVDQHSGRPVFYQLSADLLPQMVELGMQIFKLGEEAFVPLTDFTTEGPEGRGHRQSIRRVEKTGATFQIMPSAALPLIMDDLKAVSDAWLLDKQTREKSFSLGCFDEAYLKHFDVGVLRIDGHIVAFANIWAAPAASQMSIDLMRFHPCAPKGAMDYLFVQLMLWAKAQGYNWFNLGMAPLSGLDHHPLAPVWTKIGRFIFMHGENFYNFEGLRFFKEKYRPNWHPTYLACTGNLSLPRALIDCASLIRGKS
jgi:phosphatidylglycerol lysyltransferase